MTKYYEQYTKEEIDEICMRMQTQLMERHPRMLDDPILRWHYQKWILSTPIRLFKRLVRWLKR